MTSLASTHRVTPLSVTAVMDIARRRYRQVTPAEAASLGMSGALIVDTRCADQRREHGIIPGSVHVPLSILPWRADPQSGYDDPRVSSDERQLILVCQDGFSSTLAVATLLDIGRERVTDVSGGFEAWRCAGLPVAMPVASDSTSKRRQGAHVRSVLDPETECA